jgi:hypothetical protein
MMTPARYSSRVPRRRFRTEMHVDRPALREFDRMNRQQKHERHIVQFIPHVPCALYDIGVEKRMADAPRSLAGDEGVRL